MGNAVAAIVRLVVAITRRASVAEGRRLLLYLSSLISPGSPARSDRARLAVVGARSQSGVKHAGPTCTAGVSVRGVSSSGSIRASIFTDPRHGEASAL